MPVLIVESDPNLSRIWGSHITLFQCGVTFAATQDEAVERLYTEDVSLILLNLVLAEGSALAVADFAGYRRPKAKILFVTNTSFFSDGSIFQHIPNACALVQQTTPPEDLAAMVDYYATAN